MARDPSGNYALPLPPVISDELIEANWANTSLNDIATALTDSLSRTGKGGMTAAFKIFDGTVTAPGLGFTSETNSGIYRFAAGDVRMTVLSNDLMRWHSTSGVQIWTGALWESLIPDAPSDSEYYSRIDGAWTVNPLPAANEAAITALDARVTQNEADIVTNADGIVTLAGNTADALITAQAWTGQNLQSTRVDGDFDIEIRLFDEVIPTSLKSDGPIRHVLNVSTTINVAASNRHRADYQGNVTLTFSGLPTADDADLGADYQVEGSVVLWNGAAPGTLTLSGLGTYREIGEHNTTADAAQVLSYLIQRDGGTNYTTIVWSAA